MKREAKSNRINHHSREKLIKRDLFQRNLVAITTYYSNEANQLRIKKMQMQIKIIIIWTIPRDLEERFKKKKAGNQRKNREDPDL